MSDKKKWRTWYGHEWYSDLVRETGGDNGGDEKGTQVYESDPDIVGDIYGPDNQKLHTVRSRKHVDFGYQRPR